MKSEFLIAITQLAAERHLPREVVLNAVEAALISAFKKEHLAELDLAVRISPGTGDVHVFAKRTVVADEAVEDPRRQLGLSEARRRRPEAQVGAVVEEEVTPANAGRIAAQTAKQVVMQRLREAERELVFAEYAGKEGEVVPGVVQRYEGRNVIVDLGRAEALMPPGEQVAGERYRAGLRLKVLVVEVGKSAKGPQIVVSRAHKDLLRRLLELEVPEIHNGIVRIEAVAREPGGRSKVAVRALQERVDPVGCCVGLRGVRIQNIVNELHGEKIDVLEWSPDAATFIAKALAPAQVLHVVRRPESHTAIVVVPDRQLALAIGREGQNARLAAKLTGWRIDIKSMAEAEAQQLDLTPQPPVLVAPAVPTVPPPVAAPVPAVPSGREAGPEASEGEAPAPVEEPGEEAAEEAPTLAEALASAETWKVPTPAAAPPEPAGAPRPAIRFAEDILQRPRGGAVKKQREPAKRVARERDEEKARKARKAREVDLEDYELETEELGE